MRSPGEGQGRVADEAMPPSERRVFFQAHRALVRRFLGVAGDVRGGDVAMDSWRL